MVGQRWIIIISTYIVEIGVMGLCSAFPVLFSTLLEKFSESRARTATTPSIIFGVAGCSALLYVPHGGFLIVLTDIMKSQGLSEENITLAYLIHSISNLLGRMSFGLLKQVPRIGILSIVLLLACMSTISFSTVHLAKDFKSAAVACFFLGFEFGAAAPAIPIGTLHILGHANMPTGMGFIFSVAGVGNIGIGPVTGLIRDTTGSYEMSLWTYSLSAGIAAIFFFAAIIIKHRAQRRKINYDISEDVVTVTRM
ncbi:hypothetical protein CHS0354_000206 [Potamilus streckersoni]|uniref:Major facilitator superfamily (MFS) profile domain-containing protein n=1 Tax=Potamilus streckersoni TaxID=2493646 RepID=A0AAE0RQS2_9BIVA|nr:hypothetical protein CHS0354_000206 [Potamilus streckersoni]